jgi:hypothetical protein
MALGDRQAAKLIGLAQAQIAEPVLAAAVVSPKGKQGAQALGGLAGLAIHNASKTKTGFASTNVFAITDTALHAFKAGNNFGVKLKEPIGSWPWGAFGAATTTGTMTQFLFLSWSDGSITELEAQHRGAGKFQGALINEVVRRAAAAGAAPPLV